MFFSIKENLNSLNIKFFSKNKKDIIITENKKSFKFGFKSFKSSINPTKKINNDPKSNIFRLILAE